MYPEKERRGIFSSREHSKVLNKLFEYTRTEHKEIGNKEKDSASDKYRNGFKFNEIENGESFITSEVDEIYLWRRAFEKAAKLSRKISFLRESLKIGAVPEVPLNNARMPKVETILRKFLILHPPRVRKRLLFWSGTGIDKAREFARKHDMRILEDITEGHYNSWALKELPGADADTNWKLQYPMWVRLSLAFAEFAEDEASVMIEDDEQAVRLDSIWNAYERPVLRSRNIKINWYDGNERPRQPLFPVESVSNGEGGVFSHVDPKPPLSQHAPPKKAHRVLPDYSGSSHITTDQAPGSGHERWN